MRAYCEQRRSRASYRVVLDAKLTHPSEAHPFGGITGKLFEQLEPLLAYQPFVHEVVRHDGGKVDVDLDRFRTLPLDIHKGSLPRWYFNLVGTGWDLSQPWLEATRTRRSEDAIVVSRSARYRNARLSYGFLAQYPKVLFVGLPEECEEMRRSVPRLEHVTVADFLELAAVIRSCRLFVGNQSFAYALAEALKVPRVLEPSIEWNNVIPTGSRAYEAYFQDAFEHFVAQLGRG